MAEDNIDNQNLAKTFLQKAGYTVGIAENGKLAVEAVRNLHYDLILMDVQMPEMDGFEATGEIRRREREEGLERMPIITLTAHAVEGYREKCLENGMDDYITKPIKKIVLLETIGKWIDPRHTVLVADDSVDNRELIKNYLKTSINIRLYFASNGQEAFDICKKRIFSLLLMDTEMPVMDGYAAAATIRNLENGQGIPIIAMTARTGTSEVNKCLNAGCTAYIPKPIRKDTLLEIIYQYIPGAAKP
ncbi:MAG: response regulator [Candidatus Brocadiaceae bacterium]